MTDLATDLTTRWKPTDNQIKLANVVTDATGDAVYTLHLLVNKVYGFWTEDVEVIGLDGIYTDRATALEALGALTKAYHKATGRTVVGGYARHGTEHGKWAVWDDILAVYPKERS